MDLEEWTQWRRTHYYDGTPRPEGGPQTLLDRLLSTPSGAQALRQADLEYALIKQERVEGNKVVSPRFNRAVHGPSDDCANYHCHYHHVDEAPSRRKGAWVCFECCHTFPSGRHLLSDYRKMIWGVYPPGWARIWRWLTVRRSQITHCPHCAHDF